MRKRRKTKNEKKKTSAELSVGHLWPSCCKFVCAFLNLRINIKHYACTIVRCMNNVPYTGTMTSYTLSNTIEGDWLADKCVFDLYLIFFVFKFSFALFTNVSFLVWAFSFLSNNVARSLGIYFTLRCVFEFLFRMKNVLLFFCFVFNGLLIITIHILVWFSSLIMCILFFYQLIFV